MTRLPLIVLIILIVLATNVSTSRADDELPWLPANKLPKAVSVLPAEKAGEPAILQISGPAAVTILEVANPKVPSHHYMLRGKVKYDGVEQTGFVEMWSHFPEGGQYFSRTLGDAGPMGRIEGTSDWREIALPFFSEPGKLPVKLVVNVVLKGKGTVQLTPLTLTNADALNSVAGEWWNERESGLIGGIGGAIIGLIGGLIGLLASAGVARQLVVGLCVAVIAVGTLGLVIGIVALTLGQPWYVYFPLLLGGVIGVTVCGGNLPGIRKRFDALELRRMSALDA